MKIFLICIFLVFALVLEIIVSLRLRKTLKSEKLSYIRLENSYDGIREFKHDFSNIMQSIGGYLSTDDLNGLKCYYSSIFKECNDIKRLSLLNKDVFNSPPVLALISNKFFKAKKLGIDMNIESLLDFNTINMDIYEFTRILGIFLDNSIEAASSASQKNINILIYKDSINHFDSISIENSCDGSGINTSKIKVLKHKEMIELFKKYQNGDLMAKDELVEGNLKLVLSILKKYQNKTDNMDDLFQIGCVGLMKAIDNFDLEHGVKFSTYAVPLILGEVRRYLRDNSNLRISRSIKDLAYKILKTKEEYFMDTGKELSNEEVAKKLEVDEIDVVVALDAMRDPISMFEPIYNGDGDTIYLEDQIESKKDKTTNWDILISLNGAIDELKEKERKIITERFLIGKTQMEIAEEIGISQAQVSRLEKGGIENIKKRIS